MAASTQLQSRAAPLLGLLHEATGRLRAHVAVLASHLRAGAASLQSSLEPLLRQKPALLAGCGAAAGVIIIWEAGRSLTRRYLPRRPLLPPPPLLNGHDAFHRVVGSANPARLGVWAGGDPASRNRVACETGGTAGKHVAGHPPMQVVLTGGPLGGKSSLAAHLVTELQQRGVAVFVAPSVAALFLNCGCTRPDAGDAQGLLQFECAVLQLQLSLEASFQRIAAASRHERCVIIYDRGVLDVAAFLPRELWGALHELAPQQRRPIDYYRAIVHLVTAADGASFDEARGGSKAAALRLDAAVHEVQHAHPNYVRVDNSTDFEGKLRRATQAVLQKLRLPP